MSRELLQRARYLLEVGIDTESALWKRAVPVIEEIEAYLFQPGQEPEPVAWMYDWHDQLNATPTCDYVTAIKEKTNHVFAKNVRPLYLAPPDQSARIAELEQQLAELQAKTQASLNINMEYGDE